MSGGRRSRRRWIAGIVAFVGIILYTTLASIGDDGLRDPALQQAAETACQEAVGDRTSGPRFPFAPRVGFTPDDRLHVQGMVDTGADAGPLSRYNYECLLSRELSGDLALDSIALWQSH